MAHGRDPGPGRVSYPISTHPADVTFGSCLEHVFGIVRTFDRPVSLVGHSGGGLLVTAFAERWPEHTSRLIYVAGMMLPGGESFEELVKSVSVRHPEASGIWPHLEWSEDRRVSRVPAKAAIAFFLQDCEASEAGRCGPTDAAGGRWSCRDHSCDRRTLWSNSAPVRRGA
jgi:pimeloyl-ACP methyl ester carboxylesterase